LNFRQKSGNIKRIQNWLTSELEMSDNYLSIQGNSRLGFNEVEVMCLMLSLSAIFKNGMLKLR
jgi:hypothetical protein